MCHVCGDVEHDASVSRRRFLGAALSLAALSGAVRAADPPKAGAPNAIPPADALKRLMEGNARYAANSPSERDFSSIV